MRASVRIDKETYLELKRYFESVAVHRSKERLAREIFNLPYQPFAPVHRQLRAIVWAVNERRIAAGFERVPLSCVRIYRTLPKHFGDEAEVPAPEKAA